MKDDIVCTEVNKHLERYGRADDGRVRFRVVWAPEQVEKRAGHFAVVVDSMYLGTTYEMREVPKYSYMPECYVLEELIFGQELAEVPDSKHGIYEPLYTFASKHDVPLPLNLRVLEIVMYARLHPKRQVQIYHDNKNVRAAKDAARVRQDIDSIDTTVMLTRFRHGESNFTPGIGNAPRTNKRRT
jgi:hypothetical protein